MANYALFDVETTIDWQLVEDVEEIDREQFIEFLENQRDQQRARPNQDVFIPWPYHVPAVIGVGLISATGELEHIGCVRGDDSEAVTREFWKWLQEFQSPRKGGTLVSFNGRSFDLPVLQLAAYRYGIRISRYLAEKYGARYRFQDDFHVDVMDYMTNYGAAPGLRGGLKMLTRLAGDLALPPVPHSNLDDPPIERMQRWVRNDIRRLYVAFQRLQFMRGRVETFPVLPELEDES